MARDRVGNSLQTAKRVNLNNRGLRFRDAINQRNDQDDLYRIRLRSRSTLELDLSNQQRGGNANVEVYGLTQGRRRVLNDIGTTDFSDLRRRDIRQNLERVGRSRRRGSRDEVLNLNLDAGTYYVRILSQQGQTRYRLDLASTPVPEPFIRVTSPNGGESLSAGESTTITWEDAIDERVKIDLVSNGSFVSTIVDATASDGRFRWEVPATLSTGNDYTIRISSTSDSSLFDDSNASFNIQRQASAQSFNIQLDYRFDTQGWFTSERRAALETAATIWEAIIQDEFDNVSSGTRLLIENPQTGAFEEFDSDFEIDDLVIFVGARNLGSLAEGGPSGIFTVGGSLDTRFNGSEFEPWTGSITFDSNEDWFFDTTPETANDIPSDRIDFLSVAVHEMGHVLGFGTSDAFDALISGNSFRGANAIAENGGDPVPLAPDDSHIQDGYEFGGSGELAFDPILNTGDRTLPTRLDVATLDDIGYTINYGQTFRNT